MLSPDLSSNPSSSYSSISFSPSSSSHVLSSPPSSPGNLNSRRVKQRQKSDVGLQELKFDFSEKQKTTRPPLIRSKSYVSHPKKALSNDFEVKDKSELVKQSPKKSPRKSPRISIAGLKFLTSSHYEKLQIAFNQFQEEMGSIQDRSSISPSSSDSSENPTSISLNKIFEADFEEIYQSLKSMESSKDEEAISLERLVEYLVSLKSESESKSRFVQMIQSESKADYRQKLFEMLIQKFRSLDTQEKKSILEAMALFSIHTMKRHQLVACKDLIDETSRFSFFIFILVKIRLRNFPAKQLISHIEDTSYDNAPYNEAITSSHLWFTSSSQLIKVWCQRFEKSKKKNRLLTFLFIFLSYPHGTLTLKEIKNLQTLLNHPNEGLDENLITSTRLKLTDCLIAAEKIPTPHSSEPSPKPNLKSLNELNSDIESNFEGCVKQFSLELQTYFAHLFMKLNPLEFVNQQWIDHPNQTPNYTNFIETTKGLLRFCSLFILQADTEKTRTDHYKFLLTIALKALEQRNFAVAHVIFASLQLPAISRLKMTKNKKFQEKLTKLNKLLTPHNNSKSYREELVKKSTLPTIPIVELFSTDLSLQGNHPKFLLNGHLNHELLISLHGYYSLLEKQQTCLKDWDGLNHKPTYDMEMLKLTPKEFQGVEFDQFTYNLSQQHEPD